VRYGRIRHREHQPKRPGLGFGDGVGIGDPTEASLKRVATGTLCLLVPALGLSGGLAERRPDQAAAAEVRPTSIADQVVHDLCGKRVALLGEPPMHGFGRTLELKVEVARRLVDECHFTAFFIESGAYDFLNIQKHLKAGKTVTEAMVAAAIGGLWANREVKPLVSFLLEKAQRGTLVLGGLDDQLGRGTHAQQQMPSDLVDYLQGEDKVRCLAILQKHTLWQYTSEAPYNPKDKALILGCLGEIGGRLSPSRESAVALAEREHDLAMVENLKRYFARDFQEVAQPGIDLRTQGFNDRDLSMFTNFQWFMSRLKAGSKVVVWTATNHAAKSLSGVPAQEKYVPLGSYIQREFNDDAFVLGFTAYSGSYAMARQPARPLVEAPQDSLEARAFDKDGSDTRYFKPNEIRKLGSIPGRPLGLDFKAANWNAVLDGLVVFREERPPQWSSR
jgi:erythromycin esterase-like protein